MRFFPCRLFSFCFLLFLLSLTRCCLLPSNCLSAASQLSISGPGCTLPFGLRLGRFLSVPLSWLVVSSFAVLCLSGFAWAVFCLYPSCGSLLALVRCTLPCGLRLGRFLSAPLSWLVVGALSLYCARRASLGPFSVCTSLVARCWRAFVVLCLAGSVWAVSCLYLSRGSLLALVRCPLPFGLRWGRFLSVPLSWLVVNGENMKTKERKGKKKEEKKAREGALNLSEGPIPR